MNVNSLGFNHRRHGHHGFQFNYKAKEPLANFLCFYEDSGDETYYESGWVQCLPVLKKHKYSTGEQVNVDDIVRQCIFREKHIFYVPGFHAGPNGEAEAAKITMSNIKVPDALAVPKDWTLSEEGK